MGGGHLFDADRLGSSWVLLLTFVALGAAAGLLYWSGVIGLGVKLSGAVVRGSVLLGFRLWKRLFAWAPWQLLLGGAVVLIVLGGAGGHRVPALAVLLGAGLLFVGVTTCLAYVFIDLERYEVARGYKALHNPLKGQELAVNLVHYGRHVGVPLLLAATVSTVGGFALLNQGLYETAGRAWYSLGTGKEQPGFSDFLAYTLINLFRVVDLLRLAETYKYAHVTYVQQARWPAATLLALFRSFFTLVLLSQVFSVLRRYRLLSETIADFWSPHPPIHERARGSLPQHGPSAAGALLLSLRAVEVMTTEQRQHLPRIIADIGPAAVPILVRHLDDPSDNVRGVAAAALGLLHARDMVPALITLRRDGSPWVRECMVEALGSLAAAGPPRPRPRAAVRRSSRRWLARLLRRTHAAPLPRRADPAVVAVAVLRTALADEVAAVRGGAARALGTVGPAAAGAAEALVGLLDDRDEDVRCRAADALGSVGGPAGAKVTGLVKLLADPTPAVRLAGARALGDLKGEAAGAVPSLLALVQERDEEVRRAAAEAIGRIGTLDGEALPVLTEGLASRDNLVRAQTAEALGEIGATAAEAAPVLAEALADSNDRVRAKAAEALGKMGEAASEAVPQLVRALRDEDNWVSALAAEALGEIGNGAAAGVPALARSLHHLTPQVRANAAEALGKMGEAAASAVPALAVVARDEDAEVRRQALFALGEIGHLTPEAREVLVAALADGNPEVREAAVNAVGRHEGLKGAAAPALLRGLEDTNDKVKAAVARALPPLLGASPEALAGLARLLADDNHEVQAQAARSLGKLGPAAAGVGEALAQAARAGEVEVREQALQALAFIQPPEALAAFLAGLKDAQGEVRKMASAGLLKVTTLPAEAGPDLVEALRDPELQVRANAARALSRLDTPPPGAAAALAECAAAADDGLRLNAALALRRLPPAAAAPVFLALLADPSPRLRLLATGCLLEADPGQPEAGAALVQALTDPTPRFRKAALGVVESLGAGGVAFRDALQQRTAVEVDAEVSDLLGRVLEGLKGATVAAPGPAAAAAG